MDLHEIREAFRRTGKSRAGLADCLGVDVSQISRLLNGKRHLKVHEVPLIREYFYGENERPSNYSKYHQRPFEPTPTAQMYRHDVAQPVDPMQALDTISALIDEAEQYDVDVADTIVRALRQAINAQRHLHNAGF